MSNHSRRKGADGEREIVALARAAGLVASREWANAQHPDPKVRCRDVQIAGQPYQVQVEANGFARIYRKLEGVRGYFFRADRQDWLVALHAEDYLKLLVKFESGKRP